MYTNLITRDDVVQYVTARLGSPCIDLELELQEKDGLGHVHLAINDSLDYMVSENQDESAFADYMVLYARKGIIEYDVPEEVVAAVDAAPSWGNGFTPWVAFDVGASESLVATTGWSQFDITTYAASMRYIADTKKLVGLDYQVFLDPQAHKMKIYPTPRENRAIMVRVYRKAKLARIFSNYLFRDLVTARTGEIWGQILSKDDAPMPGGGKVNGQAIWTHYSQMVKDMEEKIFERSRRPFIMAM
jgi:hypothetical protein